MRIETLGPRTWLLGAIAAWSLLVWALALAGLGGKVAPLGEDPGMTSPLPQWRTPAAPALGAPQQYAGIAARPLFDENRRPRPFVIEGSESGENAAQSFDYVLTSVLIAPTLRMAIIEPSAGGEPLRVREGMGVDAAPGWRLAELSPRSAAFEGPSGRQVLELRAFAGVAGPPPAAAPASAPGAAPPPAAATAPAPAAATLPTRVVEPAPAQTSQEQLDAIRKRIEARRRALREQSATQPPTKP